jgi:hypothetical protein
VLAEIHNKISQTGSNLSDRLEDKLTGDFFGTIRYLPFEKGLKHVFSTVELTQIDVKRKWMDFIENQTGYEGEIKFWPRQEEGEIDLLITYKEALIGIEVKYLSGISSEDQDNEVQLDYTESLNQLSIYSRMLEKLSNGRTAYLLFLAPYEMMNVVKKDIENRFIISPSVQLGFMCWQDILDSLKGLDLDLLETGQQMIISDLQDLLSKKGLIRFKGFSGELLHQPVMNSAYIFQGDNTNKNTWNWSNTIIKENDYYVYNN